ADVGVEIARVARRIVVNAGVPGEREAGLILIARANRPAAEDRVGQAAPVVAPLLAVAPREIHRRAEGGAVRSIIWRNAILEDAVRRVEEVEAVGLVRARVRRQDGVVSSEALLDDDRRPLVMIRPSVLLGADADGPGAGDGAVGRAGEVLREGTEQLRAADRCAVERRAGQQALERIRDRLAEERFLRGVARARGGEVLQRKSVELAHDREVRAARVEVVALHAPAAAEVAL